MVDVILHSFTLQEVGHLVYPCSHIHSVGSGAHAHMAGGPSKPLMEHVGFLETKHNSIITAFHLSMWNNRKPKRKLEANTAWSGLNIVYINTVEMTLLSNTGL